MRKIEFGPFTTPEGACVRIAPGWETLSAVPGENVDHVGRWGYEPLPFPDNTFDLIHAAHILEHIDFWRAIDAMKEALRVLKPGGWMEIHVPDIRWLIQRWQTGQMDGWVGHGLATDQDTGQMIPGLWFNCRVLGFSESPHWKEPREHYRHRTIYDPAFLEYVFRKAGFVDVRFGGMPRGPEKHGAHPGGALALNLSRKGRKP